MLFICHWRHWNVFTSDSEPVLLAVPKPLLTEFGIYHRLENCVCKYNSKKMYLLYWMIQPLWGLLRGCLLGGCDGRIPRGIGSRPSVRNLIHCPLSNPIFAVWNTSLLGIGLQRTKTWKIKNHQKFHLYVTHDFVVYWLLGQSTNIT